MTENVHGCLGKAWLEAVNDPSREVLTMQIMVQNPDLFRKISDRVVQELAQPWSKVKYAFLGASEIAREYPVMAFEVPLGTGVEVMASDLSSFFDKNDYGYFICNKASGLSL